MAPRAAASSSSAADIVSIQATSAPPSARPLACSVKAATALSMVRAPSSSKSSPVGPMEPATTISLPLSSATVRAIVAASRFNSVARSCRLSSFSRKRVAPKLLVRMMSEPASTKRRCRAATFSGKSSGRIRGLARGEAHVEVVGACRAVGDQSPTLGKQLAQSVGHRNRLRLERPFGRLRGLSSAPPQRLSKRTHRAECQTP